MALVTGAIVTKAMTGGMLAQYPLVKLVSYVGWRQAVQDMGIVGLAMLGLMFLWIKEKPSLGIEESKPLAILQQQKKPT